MSNQSQKSIVYRVQYINCGRSGWSYKDQGDTNKYLPEGRWIAVSVDGASDGLPRVVQVHSVADDTGHRGVLAFCERLVETFSTKNSSVVEAFRPTLELLIKREAEADK